MSTRRHSATPGSATAGSATPGSTGGGTRVPGGTTPRARPFAPLRSVLAIAQGPEVFAHYAVGSLVLLVNLVRFGAQLGEEAR